MEAVGCLFGALVLYCEWVEFMDPIRVIVVDDHPIFRQGVIDSLSLEPMIEVVGQAENGEAALALMRVLQPDVAVLDVNLPAMNGHQVTYQAQRERLPTRVILLTAYDDLEQKLHALGAGARAYCAKDIRPERLVQIIKWVAEGRYVVQDQVMTEEEVRDWMEAHRLGAYRLYADDREVFQPLSPREMEVLIEIVRGSSNKEIARRFGISHQTVKNHVTSILRKLGVEDRTQAAVFALQRGWIRPEMLDEE